MVAKAKQFQFLSGTSVSIRFSADQTSWMAAKYYWGIKEYCALIDSSSSFRAYRHALSESTPPCIPYVGLVLQDLTFVHIGNSDNFDGKVNFAKRWQQFNILDNLRRFKKETYPFKRKDEIVNFFANFENYWTEDQMWAESEKIKPRGKKSKWQRGFLLSNIFWEDSFVEFMIVETSNLISYMFKCTMSNTLLKPYIKCRVNVCYKIVFSFKEITSA